MSAGTDLSFVVNVGQAVDLYDLSGEGSKFFITVNGKYQGATLQEFSCNMWPSTYNKYKIETIKRETEELGDNSFSYMSTDVVKDVSFDMSFVTGTVNACTKFYVNQGDRSVSCLPGTGSGSHSLDEMIFYNLYDMSGGWYSKVKVSKEVIEIWIGLYGTKSSGYSSVRELSLITNIGNIEHGSISLIDNPSTDIKPYGSHYQGTHNRPDAVLFSGNTAFVSPYYTPTDTGSYIFCTIKVTNRLTITSGTFTQQNVSAPFSSVVAYTITTDPDSMSPTDRNNTANWTGGTSLTIQNVAT